VALHHAPVRTRFDRLDPSGGHDAVSGEDVPQQLEGQRPDRRAGEVGAEHRHDVAAVGRALVDHALAHAEPLDHERVEVDRVGIVQDLRLLGHPGGADRVHDEPHRRGRT
jgi:hypothetical protein